MTAYDHWKTSAPEGNDEAWEDAVVEVANRANKYTIDEMVDTLAVSDDALKWVCGAVTIPGVHLHAFRDLVKLAQNYRNLVEKEMKAYHDDRD